MKSARPISKWVVGPLVLAALAACVGKLRADARLFPTLAASPEADRKALEAAPRRAVGNVAWALGSVDGVRQTAKWELDHLAEAEGRRRAQILTRFGVVDTNPDGQAAVFGQVCVADPPNCDHRKETAERETKLRLVAPGNRLPLFFIPNHPHVPGI